MVGFLAFFLLLSIRWHIAPSLVQIERDTLAGAMEKIVSRWLKSSTGGPGKIRDAHEHLFMLRISSRTGNSLQKLAL
jgi:hypothetical protein